MVEDRGVRMWLFLLLQTSWADCPDTEQLLEELEEASVEGRFADMGVAMDAVVDSLGCGVLARPEWVARMWLAEALARSTDGEEQASEDALASATRVAPSYWNELYGPVWRERWVAASRKLPGAAGSLTLELFPEGYGGAVDGEWVSSFPARVEPGLHVVQVGPSARNLQTAMIVDLPSGLELVLQPQDFGWSAPVVEQRPRPITSQRGRRIRDGLLMGLAGGAIYGAALGTEAAYYAQAPEDNVELRLLTNGLVVTSAGTGLLSLGLVLRGLSTPSALGEAP